MSNFSDSLREYFDKDRKEGWRSLWADFNDSHRNPPKGYKTEFMYSDYDGYAIKYRFVKND